jgi:hypothetical protein
MKRKRSHLPVCTCGSRDFVAVFSGRNATGRAEFRLACRQCRSELHVDKTTFALFRYIGRHTPSRRFLELYDMV